MGDFIKKKKWNEIGVKNEIVYEMSRELMEKLAVEALQVAMVRISVF